MVRAVSWIIPVVCLAFTGCSNDATDAAEPPSGGTEDASDGDSDTSGHDGVSDPGGSDDSGSGNPADEVDPSGTERFCGPAPRDRTAKMASDLFERAMAIAELGCSLERIESDDNGDGVVESTEAVTQPTEMACDSEGNCERTLPSFAWAWSQTSEQDFGLDRVQMYEGRVEGRHSIEAGVERIALSLMVGVTGSTADRRVDRIYDGDGRLLSEDYFFAGSPWFALTNQWEGERLVEQRFVDDINVNGQETVSRWTWDSDGRMLTSEIVDISGRVQAARFTYDEMGRLIGLQRDTDGVRWLTQSWTYDGLALVSRNHSFTSQSWGQYADRANPEVINDYMSHWDQSMPTRDGDCALPPLSLAHGYPDHEKIYRLGWSRDDVPSQVGFAYGYNGYGWSYGDYAWFGHGAIATHYGPDRWVEGSEVTVEIKYEDGVMVEEVMDFERPGTESNEWVNIVRGRDVVNGQIESDTVTTTVTVAGQTETTERVMNFQYDMAGNVTERRLFDGEHYVDMAYWTYDGAQRITEHGIYGSGNLWGDMQDEEPTDDELPHMSTYRQSTTEDSANYERRREQRDADSESWVLVDTVRRGDHARGVFLEEGYGFVVYDSDSRQVMAGGGDPHAPTYFEAWTSGEHDLLQTWEVGSPEGGTIRRYVHVCDE